MKKSVIHLLKNFCIIFFLGVMIFFSVFISDAYIAKAESQDSFVPTPINLNVSVTNCTATINFQMPEGFDNTDILYRIQYAQNGNWENLEYDTYIYDTSFEFYWLQPGQKYYFRVRAEHYLDESKASKWKTVAAIIAYNPVELVSAKAIDAKTIQLAWNISYDGEGYRVYRSTSKNGSYTRLKTIRDIYTTSYTDKNLKPGVTYYYKVCTYSSWLTYPNGQSSNIKQAYPRPQKATLSANSNGIKSVKLSWKVAESGVNGYEIHRATSAKGTYKRIKTVSSRSTTSYVDKKTTFAKYYYYKIRSYSIVNGKRLYGPFSSIKKANAMVTAPTITSVKIADVTKATITWKKVANASGYRIYCSTSKNGTYKSVKVIKGNKTFKHTVSKLKNGKVYYFKIRAYRTVKKKNYYSAYSLPKGRLMNRLGYENEDYFSKSKRIFGTDYYKEYTSAKSASKQMKTIKVKTWDINSKGKKVTKYHYITVHKKIAGTVTQIFKEIYAGKEKFPIKDIGGYAWRGNNSSSEHCEGLAIDINPNENAQFSGDSGKPMVGSCYKPGKNPYSIKPNGDVVKAFRKYGFSWGNWFYNPDYMHFSYFGR